MEWGSRLKISTFLCVKYFLFVLFCIKIFTILHTPVELNCLHVTII